MKNYIVYKRLSRVSKSGDNLGLDAQQSAIDGFFRHQDPTTYKILGSYEEIETGTRKKVRPQFNAAVEECLKHGATLLISKLDRLSRDLGTVLKLQDSKVDFIALDMRDASPLTIHIFSAIAMWEAKTISQRTSAALQELKRNGKALGRAGKDNLRLPQTIEGVSAHRCRLKQSAVTFAKKAYPAIAYYKQQGLSSSKIATELNNLGQAAPNGKAGAWTRASVDKCMRRVSSGTTTR